jgi:surface antigen
MRIPAVIFVTIWLSLLTANAFADPPPWAPAHGYRDKQDGDEGKGRKKRKGGRESYYVGYSGREYVHDFGIPDGRCNREEVGAVLGGVVGGVIANQTSSRDNRVVATILGAAVGALIGAKIGRDMDDRDRGCFGQALELGTSGRRVSWTNRDSGVRYVLVPLDGQRGGAQVCRDFRLTSTRGTQSDLRSGRACQVSPGNWQLATG